MAELSRTVALHPSGLHVGFRVRESDYEQVFIRNSPIFPHHKFLHFRIIHSVHFISPTHMQLWKGCIDLW